MPDSGSIRSGSAMRTMQAHGLMKALAGETSVAEVLRATRDG
jgi:type II secretory ATPase GspE/PulE/Tfp pilus assembly ATPase PilB-like protein